MNYIWRGAFRVLRLTPRLIACLFLAILLSHLAARSAQAAGVSPDDEDAPVPAAAAPASAAASFTVFAPLVQTPATTDQLIRAAVQRGEIGEETGLIYQVFAAHGDDRLPARYRGDDSAVTDTMIMAVVDMRFDGLSAEAQATLAPFRLAPAEPGSWLDLREGGAHGNAQGAEPATLLMHRVLATNDKAWVWYLAAHPGDEAKARALAAELSDRIWPALTAKMGGRIPLSDAGKPGGGVDGRLDIYLVPLGFSGEAPALSPGCKGTPAYINLNRTLNSTRMKAVLAHEFMHVLSWTYQPNGHCVFPGEYAWLMEATGKWAEEAAYHDLNMDAEWPYAPAFLKTPKLPLEQDPDSPFRWYGAYLWLFYLDNTHLGDPVSDIWAASAGATDSLDAVNRSIEGGFVEQWSRFTLRNWNKPPVDDYNTWDPGLTYNISQYANAVERRDISLAGLPDFAFNLDLSAGIEHLAARYYHLKFTDDDVRTAVFYNGYSYKLSKKDINDSGIPYGIQRVAATLSDADRKGRHVRALVKISGKPWKEENWTAKPFVSYCRDKTDERIEEIVLVFSNSDHSDRARKIEPVDLPPTLWASNTGCWKWTGTSEFDHVDVWGVRRTARAEITWSRPTAFVVSAVNDEYALRATYFRPQGSMDWTVSGTDSSNNCSYSGSGRSTGLRGSLDLYNFTVEGERHRGYYGTVWPTDGPTDSCWDGVTRTCPWRTEQICLGNIFPFFVTWESSWGVKTMDADGAKMINQMPTWFGVPLNMTWDFKAERQ